MNFFIAQSSAIHATVQDWSNRVQKNGGALPSGDTQRALSDFMKGMDAYNLTPKVKSINCFVPDNLTAALTPLVRIYGNDPWTNVNFIASDLTINGLKGDGIGKYLRTGVIPNGFMAAESAGSIYYLVTAGNTNYNCIGSCDDTGRLRNGWDTTAGYGNYAQSWADANQAKGNNNTAWFVGYICAAKTATNLITLYWANSTTPHTASGINTGTDPGGSSIPSSRECAVFSGNEGGVFAPAGNSGRLSFAALSRGLLADESKNLYTLIQAMRQQLGGGYV
jgi:hypothetical protein